MKVAKRPERSSLARRVRSAHKRFLIAQIRCAPRRRIVEVNPLIDNPLRISISVVEGGLSAIMTDQLVFIYHSRFMPTSFNQSVDRGLNAIQTKPIKLLIHFRLTMESSSEVDYSQSTRSGNPRYKLPKQPKIGMASLGSFSLPSWPTRSYVELSRPPPRNRSLDRDREIGPFASIVMIGRP